MASNPSQHIHRSVLQLAVPSILANITIPLVGIVDVAIIGHLSDAIAVAGIALGTMLFDLLYWNFGFLRTGTSGLTAQAYGRGDTEACKRLLGQGVSTALLVALCMLLLQWVFVTGVLWCIPCSAEAADFAQRYFFVRIWAAPATLSLMAMKGWFIGMQNTRASMVVDLTVNLTNIAASWLLAITAGMGAIGVAWGTLVAQYAGLLIALALLWGCYGIRLRKLPYRLPERQFFSLNANLFVRSVCMLIIYVGYTIIASSYGDTELAVSNILMKLFLFFSYFADGFAYAGEALIGRLGASNENVNQWQKTADVRQAVRVLLYWAGGIGLLFSVLYGLLAGPLVALMTSDSMLQHAAESYYIWLGLMPIASSLAFVWDGVFIGKADGKALRNSLIVAVLAFVSCYLMGQSTYLIQALYAAYFLHLAVRSIYLSFKWLQV